jgi:YHS domain-containing protein
MNKAMFYGLLVLGLTFASCNTKKATPADENISAPPKEPVKVKLAELASKKDLNCDMELIEGHVADTAIYQSKIYGFCSTECKADFLKDPEAHLAKK